MDANKFEQQRNSIVELLTNEIEKKTDDLLISRSKKAANPVDREVIRRQFTREVFNNINDSFDGCCKTAMQFYLQLRQDDDKLYNLIVENIKENVKVSDEPIFPETSITLKQKFLDKLQKIGLTWFHHADWQKAHLYFSYLSLFEVGNPVIWVLKGMSEHNLGKYKEAAASYIYALTIAPEYGFAKIQLIKCMIASKHEEDAKKIYQLYFGQTVPHSEETDQYIISEMKSIKDYLFARAA